MHFTDGTKTRLDEIGHFYHVEKKNRYFKFQIGHVDARGGLPLK